MPRTPRVFVEGGIYHVYNRFASGEAIFADPEVARDFIDLVQRFQCFGFGQFAFAGFFAFVGGEIEELRTLLERILERLEAGINIQAPGSLAVTDLRQQIGTARATADDLICRIEGSAERLKKLGQLAREAV